METLLGRSSFCLKDFLRVSDEWQTSTASGTNISIKKEWDIYNPFTIDHILRRYSGGTNGRIIAQHERSFSEISKHVITLHDHKLNKIRECVVYEKCREIYTYVTSTDELRVVTSSGRLIQFQGEAIISNLPILCPALEPDDKQSEQENTTIQKREREILSVAFWETGFVYIDRDGYIVEYQIDPSNMQIINHSIESFSYTDISTKEQYLSNVEPENNIHTKILSRDLKSIGFPICFEVIPPEFTGLPNNSPYVFVSNSTDNILYIVSENSSSSIKLPAEIISLSLSPSYKLIAIIVDPMILMIMPISLDSLLLRLEVDEGDVFEQISWVGDDVPIISFNEICILVLHNGETIKIPTNSKSFIFKQSDSALILSEKALYKASMISESVARCFGASEDKGGEEPSAFKLIRAFCNYSHSQVFQMKEDDELCPAIKDCVDSALQLECEVTTDSNRPQSKVADAQTTIMTAAVFGRSYLLMKSADRDDRETGHFAIDPESTEYFTRASKWTRLANTFKRELAICVSPKSLLDSASVDDCIARLCGRGMFRAAFEVADEFGGDKRLVVTRWCWAIVDKIDHDNKLCYQILVHMKKSLTKNSVKTASSTSSASSQMQAPIRSAFSKKKKMKDDFGGSGELKDDRSTCPLFDTAAIASGCLARGRSKLASALANDELNSSHVIPFFTASGLWKEALIAAANTLDSNVLIEVLRKAVGSTVPAVVAEAIESNYFAYSIASKIFLSRCRKTPSEDASREAFPDFISSIMMTVPKHKKTLDLHVKNKFKILNDKMVDTENQESAKLIRKTAEDIEKIKLDYPTVTWASNQTDMMSLEVKLINLYKKLIKVINFENAAPDRDKQPPQPKPPNLRDLTVNSLITFCVDSKCLSRLLEFSKSGNFEEISPRKAVTVAAKHLAAAGRFEEFVGLLSRNEYPFSSCYRVSAAVALHYFGLEKARKFASAVADAKERAAVAAMLDAAVADQAGDEEGAPRYKLAGDVYGSSMISVDLFKK